jgi:hypothetical protein
MWVKTQCGLVLVNLDNWDAVELNIEEENDICAIKDNYSRSSQLGIYATKERALEVLDEIEKAMEDSNWVYSENVATKVFPQVVVYQMPKE